MFLRSLRGDGRLWSCGTQGIFCGTTGGITANVELSRLPEHDQNQRCGRSIGWRYVLTLFIASPITRCAIVIETNSLPSGDERGSAAAAPMAPWDCFLADDGLKNREHPAQFRANHRPYHPRIAPAGAVCWAPAYGCACEGIIVDDEFFVITGVQ
jgi:hypothetical protein